MTDPEVQKRLDAAAARIREIHVDLREGRKEILVPLPEYNEDVEVVAPPPDFDKIVIKPELSKTPTCQGCGGKFTHSAVMAMCTRCGLPDEVRNLGPRMIARWKKQQAKEKGASKRQIKQATKPRSRNKHGRKGVKRGSQDQSHVPHRKS